MDRATFLFHTRITYLVLFLAIWIIALVHIVTGQYLNNQVMIEFGLLLGGFLSASSIVCVLSIEIALRVYVDDILAFRLDQVRTVHYLYIWGTLSYFVSLYALPPAVYMYMVHANPIGIIVYMKVCMIIAGYTYVAWVSRDLEWYIVHAPGKPVCVSTLMGTYCTVLVGLVAVMGLIKGHIEFNMDLVYILVTHYIGIAWIRHGLKQLHQVIGHSSNLAVTNDDDVAPSPTSPNTV